MDKDKNIKVLAFGDVEGQFDTLFKRIEAYNSKVFFLNFSILSLPFRIFQAGPFEVVFCVGEFFGSSHEDNEKLITGQLKAPSVPIYVLGPCSDHTASFYPGKNYFQILC